MGPDFGVAGGDGACRFLGDAGPVFQRRSTLEVSLEIRGKVKVHAG